MDFLLQSFDFSGIDDKYIQDIKDTCLLFQDFKFLCYCNCSAAEGNMTQTKEVWARMCGRMFGKPNFTFSVGQCKDGIHVQVGRNTCPDIFDFGVYIFREHGQQKILPYMNGLLS